MFKKKILIITSEAFKKSWKIEIIKLFSKENIIFCKDNKSEIVKNVKSCSAMVGCPRFIFSKKEYHRFKNLEWVHAGGAGIESFLTDEFKASSTVLTNGKIIQGPEVADHAVGLILSFTRNLYFIAKSLPKLQRPLELRNKKILIIGLGGIGMCLAERLSSFGAIIDGITNDMPVMTSFINKAYYEGNINKYANKYDIIVCTAPLTKRTFGLLDYSFFSKMKQDSIFINVSRGKIVNTSDLIKNNLYKKFRGIGLDVTDPEPLRKSHKLNKAQNIFITPHVAGPSDQNRERGYELIKLNILRYLSNKELLNVVNKNKEY
ncbi:MAG: hypothetical protein CMP24_03895 [Rickettsiales bacterium]|nr:hypothetical protein [Rickettsiales bacterium]